MQLVICAEILRPFWVQLFSNIGYSRVYKRYVVLEPVCYLTGYENSIDKCVPIGVSRHDKHPGKTIASFIDSNWGDHLEQWLVPYILDKKFKYILLADNPMSPSQENLVEFRNLLRRKPNVIKKLIGLIHYHIDEPYLSDSDISAMTWLTKEVKLLGAMNQVCIVVSEKEPLSILKSRKIGEEGFIRSLSINLQTGKIDVSGWLFTGEQGIYSSVEIKVKF
jgi:hypothetical protein